MCKFEGRSPCLASTSKLSDGTGMPKDIEVLKPASSNSVSDHNTEGLNMQEADMQCHHASDLHVRLNIGLSLREPDCSCLAMLFGKASHVSHELRWCSRCDEVKKRRSSMKRLCTRC